MFALFLFLGGLLIALVLILLTRLIIALLFFIVRPVSAPALVRFPGMALATAPSPVVCAGRTDDEDDVVAPPASLTPLRPVTHRGYGATPADVTVARRLRKPDRLGLVG